MELLEDEEDERALLAYRNQRIAEMQALAQKSKFGDVREIAADDWIEQVSTANISETKVCFVLPFVLRERVVSGGSPDWNTSHCR